MESSKDSNSSILSLLKLLILDLVLPFGAIVDILLRPEPAGAKLSSKAYYIELLPLDLIGMNVSPPFLKDLLILADDFFCRVDGPTISKSILFAFDFLTWNVIPGYNFSSPAGMFALMFLIS